MAIRIDFDCDHRTSYGEKKKKFNRRNGNDGI